MKNFGHKHKWLLIAGSLSVLAIGIIIAIYSRTSHPTNLGQSIEYIGKREYGCTLFWCESTPSTDYYFATNMSQEELKHYFKGGQFVKEEREEYPSTSKEFANTHITFRIDGEEFTLSYYDFPQRVKAFYNLMTAKSKIILFSQADYKLAKSAL